MKKLLSAGLALAASAMLLTSCSTYQRTMADANSRVNFTAGDFTITPPYGGAATQTKIIGIDWARLFTHRTGEITNGNGGGSFSIPIIGSIVQPCSVDNYALYDLMKTHPNYDAVFYPQFQRKTFNLLWIYSRTRVQVKARLGRLNAGTGEGDGAED